MEAAASHCCNCIELREEIKKLKEELKEQDEEIQQLKANPPTSDESSSTCNETSLEGRPLVDGASQPGPSLPMKYLGIS